MLKKYHTERTAHEAQEWKLNEALRLIKLHINPETTGKASFQDADLHKAIGHVVDVARRHGLLKR